MLLWAVWCPISGASCSSSYSCSPICLFGCSQLKLHSKLCCLLGYNSSLSCYRSTCDWSGHLTSCYPSSRNLNWNGKKLFSSFTLSFLLSMASQLERWSERKRPWIYSNYFESIICPAETPKKTNQTASQLRFRYLRKCYLSTDIGV